MSLADFASTFGGGGGYNFGGASKGVTGSGGYGTTLSSGVSGAAGISAGAGGISSPINIGGYKSGAQAATSAANTGAGGASGIPSWIWYVGAGALAYLLLWKMLKK